MSILNLPTENNIVTINNNTLQNKAAFVNLNAPRADSTIGFNTLFAMELNYNGEPELFVAEIGLNKTTGLATCIGNASATFNLAYSSMNVNWDNNLGELTFNEAITVKISLSMTLVRLSGTGDRIYTLHLLKNNVVIGQGCTSQETAGISPFGLSCTGIQSFAANDVLSIGISVSHPGGSNLPPISIPHVGLTLSEVI